MSTGHWRALASAHPLDTTHAVTSVVGTIATLRQDFSLPLWSWSDHHGGAFVVLEDVRIDGSDARFAEPTTWLGFHLNNMHPAGDIYPQYVRADLHRRDGQPLMVPLSGPIDWQGVPALQLSRVNRQHNPALCPPTLKIKGVIAWLRGAS